MLAVLLALVSVAASLVATWKQRRVEERAAGSSHLPLRSINQDLIA